MSKAKVLNLIMAGGQFYPVDSEVDTTEWVEGAVEAEVARGNIEVID